jgi:hypothetical protein
MGNRVEFVGSSNSTAGSSSSSSSSKGTQQLQLVLNHHKNSHKGMHKQITYVLPPEVCELFMFLLEVRGQLQVDGSPFLFCNPGGMPYSVQRLRLFWHKYVNNSMPPSKARSSFVTLLCDGIEKGVVVPAWDMPASSAAAYAMGTSLTMINKVYDKHAQTRAVQLGLDCLGYWRRQLGVEGVAAAVAAAAASMAAIQAGQGWKDGESEGESEGEGMDTT